LRHNLVKNDYFDIKVIGGKLVLTPSTKAPFEKSAIICPSVTKKTSLCERGNLGKKAKLSFL
jgi:hypothetical protein